MFHELSQQFAHQLAQPAAIPFALSFIIGLFVYNIRNRRRLLAVKTIRDSLSALYYRMAGAEVGAYAMAIAALGGLIQSITPDRLMQRTAIYRRIAATLLAILGVYVLAQKTHDLLPLIAVVMMRFVETAKNPQHLRMGMVPAFIMWMIYAAKSGTYLVLIAQAITLCSVFVALYRHRKQA